MVPQNALNLAFPVKQDFGMSFSDRKVLGGQLLKIGVA